MLPLKHNQDKPVQLRRNTRTSRMMNKRNKAVPRTIAFLFTGQGAQYVEMGRRLYETQPTFRATLERCAEILRPLLGESLLSVLYPDRETGGQENKKTGRQEVWIDPESKIQNLKSKIHETTYTQPALFALEYALAQLWVEWGVKPDAVLGHSVGEYVAACVAGVFSLEDGLRLIAARGRLMGALPAGGVMVAVQASEAAVAAINGPENVVLSGERTAVAAVVGELQTQGIKATALEVSHAFHSPLMEPMLADFAAIARQVTFATPQIPLVSNLTGQQVGEEITSADYWVQQVRQPVRFADGMATLQALGINTYLEIGPKPVLLGMGRLCVQQSKIQNLKSEILWLPSLRAGQADWDVLLESVGQLYLHGLTIDWQGFERDYAPARRRVALPTYPFERQRYWVEPQPYRSDQDLSGFGNLTGLSALHGRLTPLFLRQVEQTGLPQRAALSAELAALSRAYVVAALTNLGLDWRSGQRWRSEQLARQLGVVPRHQRLLVRMLALLGEADLVRREGEEWVIVQAPPPLTPQALLATFPAQVADAELALLTTCGEKLAAVLCGQEDPLMALFPSGDSSLVARFYQETREARVMNDLVAQAVQQIVNAHTGKEALRILEIGAGTGGTTRFVLPHLPAHQCEYTFTDVGRSFLKRAQESFRDYAFIHYHSLDIERAPADQGFPLQHYDVVIAANVLHATADLRQTVRHARQLLKPGGWLLLRETTRPTGLLDLTFGLTEGWWRFADHALRPDHALLSPMQWRDLLRNCHFAAVAWLPDETTNVTAVDESFLMAQADESAPSLLTVAPSAGATVNTNGHPPRASATAAGQHDSTSGGDATADAATEAIIRQQLALMQQQLMTWHLYAMDTHA
jgi:malonyl CoA-acyl carrier protein transacylase/SAM-dependent methyltransferase